jgi:hypothetical protein
MQKLKEGTADGGLFYFLEVVNNFVCLLYIYGELGSGGVRLGGFNVRQPLDGGLFFCA